MSGDRTVHVERVMGTAVSFDVRDGDAARGIASAVAWLHDVDRRFSPYRDDSLVALVRRGTRPADADLDEVLEACDSITRRSAGAFSARPGGVFDPSGYVKGWAAQRAGGLLGEAGCTHWCVNAGGDVLVSARPEHPAWRVGIRDPFDATALVGVVAVRRGAVATSGTYERGPHIVDARTGRPADAIVSATVLDADLARADAFATVVVALGEDGPAWLAAQGAACLAVRADGTAVATAGFPRTVEGVSVALEPGPFEPDRAA